MNSPAAQKIRPLIEVRNSDLTTFGVVNMAANTINLNNVAFGGAVTLQSLNGVLAPNPNTGAVSIPGDVNFIQNVTYNGNHCSKLRQQWRWYNRQAATLIQTFRWLSIIHPL
ncbi:MAG: hypothetical protein WDN00_17970 [Limisphaerales bacterium]